MKFIGRQEELERLTHEYNRDGGFVVIYGRRRVGKTTLIQKFIEDKNGFYFLSTDEPEPMCMERFAMMLSQKTKNNLHKNAHFNDWIDIFTAFSQIHTEDKKILVIDEFTYLVKNNPSFPSILQKAWDEILRNSNCMLIISGSLIGMMKKFALDHDSPLYGRRTAQIDLSPLSFTSLYEASDHSFSDSVIRYSITGGVPKYVELISQYTRTEEIMDRELLNRNGFFFEEPYLMFRDEVSSPVTYFGILKSIAAGNHRIGQIASSFNSHAEEISPYLKTLRNLRIVERRVPVTEKNPEKSRKGLYYICDNFLRFWFRYVFPFYGDISIGFADSARELIRNDYLCGFLAYVYEDVCMDIFRNLCLRRKIDFIPSQIGRFWYNAKGEDIEIDIMARDNSHQKLFAGECKYHEKPVGLSVYRDLVGKVENSSEIQKTFGKWKVIYGLFSRSGFDRELIQLAKETDNLILVYEDRICTD